MPNLNHQISLAQAIAMTTLYRANQPANMPICETFSLDAVLRLTNHAACTELRIYYGMLPDQSIHAILVAGDANGNDLLPSEKVTTLTGDDYEILEDGLRCPVTCPEPSPLNT
jgi:hypothetical protein